MIVSKIPYVYDYIQIMQETGRSHPKSPKSKCGQGKAMHRSVRVLNLVAVRPTTVQVTDCRFGVVK
jgi:hypothetical protein